MSPQALSDAGGKRLLSISRPEADKMTQSAIEGYRGVAKFAEGIDFARCFSGKKKLERL
jgi:hypothetical protein